MIMHTKLMKWLKNKLIPNEVHLCYDFIQNRMTLTAEVMFDVGAHHGTTLSEFADARWQVWAFEPDKDNHSILQKKYKGYPNVFLDDRAVSNGEYSSIPFYCSEASNGISSLLPFDDSHFMSSTVNTITLGKFCDEHKIKDIALLKIDVEGLEYAVLETVDWEKVDVEWIICEYDDGKTQKLGYSIDDTIRLLKEAGFYCILSNWYPIHKYGELHRWERFTRYNLNRKYDGWGNIIAAKNEKNLKEFYSYCRGLSWRYRIGSFLIQQLKRLSI